MLSANVTGGVSVHKNDGGWVGVGWVCVCVLGGSEQMQPRRQDKADRTRETGDADLC